MSFLPALPYTTSYKAAPYFAEVWFRFVQTTVFLLPFFLLRFIIINRSINQSQTFVNAFISSIVLVHNVYIAHKNVELVPVLSSGLCYLLRFLENRS